MFWAIVAFSKFFPILALSTKQQNTALALQPWISAHPYGIFILMGLVNLDAMRFAVRFGFDYH